MSPDLENNLFTKYPKIFNGALINQHIKCDNGWFHLLDALSYDLQSFCDIHHETPQIQAVNVMKGNDGCLRFYCLGGSQYLWKAIEHAEERSSFTCEICGDLGSLRYDKSRIKCLCQFHAGQGN